MYGLKLANKTEERQQTTFRVGDIEVGKDFIVIAGPCSVESQQQIMETALVVKSAGASILRGGAYKPRTSPYSFQGLGLKGLEYLKLASEKTGLPIITEVVDTRDVFLVGEYADILQIGARNTQNFALLKEVGRSNKPVMLKNGLYSTLDEWLNCAEYIMNEGNDKIILCERGIRTMESFTRNTLDLSAVAALKQLTHLPVFVDPSHGTGRRNLIESMSLCSILAGCDGLMVEVHPDPDRALSDGDQSLTPEMFNDVMRKIRKVNSWKRELE